MVHSNAKSKHIFGKYCLRAENIFDYGLRQGSFRAILPVRILESTWVEQDAFASCFSNSVLVSQCCWTGQHPFSTDDTVDQNGSYSVARTSPLTTLVCTQISHSQQSYHGLHWQQDEWLGGCSKRNVSSRGQSAIRNVLAVALRSALHSIIRSRIVSTFGLSAWK